MNNVKSKSLLSGDFIFAGSLKSANSSILAVHRHFKENSGQKNQDFMLIRLSYPSYMIGCGGDMHS